MADQELTPFAKLSPALQTGLLARLRNPLVGSFLLSWALYNWKIVLTATSSHQSIQDKIQSIQTLLQDKGSFLVPLALAALYFFASPWAWLWLRKYLDIPDARARAADRKRRAEEQAFEQELLDREVQLLYDRRQRLEAAKDIGRIKEQIATFFDEVSKQYSNKCDQLNRDVDATLKELSTRAVQTVETQLRKVDSVVAVIDDRMKQASHESESTLESMHKLINELRQSASSSVELTNRALSKHAAQIEAAKKDALSALQREYQALLPDGEGTERIAAKSQPRK